MQRVRLKFAGGEPTLNLKLVIDLHEYARDRAAEAGIGLEAVILSNGVALGERSIRALKARGIQVMISLDGVGAVHDSQRPFANGTGSFAWVDRALDRLDRQGVRPFVSVTVSDRNIDGLPQVVSYLLDRDLPFNLNFFRDNDCATPFQGLRAEQARLIAALHETFDIIEARLPARSLLGSLIDRARLDQAHDKPCSVGDSYLVVTHTGHIAKCQMEVERPITDIAADDPLRLVQIDRTGVQNVSVDEKEGCRDCAWKYWCGGGCPVLTYRATGRYDVKSPYCNVYKALYPRALRLEGLRLLKLSGALQ
ncbi:MAG: SPASM domain-containing protein [Anaerolineae bacterium]|nr:SPASM domain-containing protein [Anaerolineae bacterium]